MKTHVSGVNSFNSCERLWYLSDHLKYRALLDNDSLLMGQWMHYGLALTHRLYDTGLAVASTAGRQIKLWQDLGLDYVLLDKEALFQTFENLMRAHAVWQLDDTSRYADCNLEWVSTEQQIELPYYGYTLTAQWDGLVRQKQTGDLYVFERKVTKYPDRLASSIQWDLQNRFYLWAARRLYGKRVMGVLYEIIRNCDPYNVKILKSGLPSKARTELDGTQGAVYRDILHRCVIEQGLSEADVFLNYADALTYLDMEATPIFRRFPLYMPQPVVDMSAKVVLKAAREQRALLKNLKPGEYPLPALDRYTCQDHCPFRDVCLAIDDGSDVEGALSFGFVTDKERLDADL